MLYELVAEVIKARAKENRRRVLRNGRMVKEIFAAPFCSPDEVKDVVYRCVGQISQHLKSQGR